MYTSVTLHDGASTSVIALLCKSLNVMPCLLQHSIVLLHSLVADIKEEAKYNIKKVAVCANMEEANAITKVVDFDESAMLLLLREKLPTVTSPYKSTSICLFCKWTVLHGRR